MKKNFIIATRHGSKEPKVMRGPNDSHQSHREFLKQFRGKHRHPEFSEVLVAKTVTRYRLDPDRFARPAPKPKSIFQRALDAFASKPEPAPAPAPETAPKPETNELPKPKAKRTAKPKNAFAARVAAAQDHT